jgi:hypothetical protein
MSDAFQNSHDAIANLTDGVKTDILPAVAAESLELSISYKVLYELGFVLGLVVAAEKLG